MKNLKVDELKKMAKEAKVKNWWTLKKSELIEALEVDHEEEEDLPIATGSETYIKDDEEEPLATLGELVFEYGFKETKARRILRDHRFNKNGGRWVWYEDEELEEVKKVFEEYK